MRHNILKLMFLFDVNETSASKECDIYHYWYFFNKGFKFQSDVCNRCNYLLIMSISLSNTAVSNIKGSNYRCISAELLVVRP